MTPIPVARPMAPGIILPRVVPVHDVHMVVHHVAPNECRYLATSSLGTWSGRVETDAPQVALLDGAIAIRSAIREDNVIRLATRIPRPALPEHLANDLEGHLPGLRLAYETTEDRPVLNQLDADLTTWLQSAALVQPPVIVATDGSVTPDMSGHAWLTAEGDHGLHSRRHGGFNRFRVVATELRAVAAAIEAIPHRRLSFLIDSQSAISILERWKRGQRASAPFEQYVDGTEPLETLRRRALRHRTRLRFHWVKGHAGHPLNEGADALATLARRSRKDQVPPDERTARAATLATAFAAEFRSTLELRSVA